MYLKIKNFEKSDVKVNLFAKKKKHLHEYYFLSIFDCLLSITDIKNDSMTCNVPRIITTLNYLVDHYLIR
jgi:hypothetical protein